jgi:WD40 repeat protein
MYVTASKDGSVRVWDGVTSQCVRSIVGAHTSTEATSATFTKDQRYMLCILANCTSITRDQSCNTGIAF